MTNPDPSDPGLEDITGVPSTAWAAAPDLDDIKGANTIQHSIHVDDDPTP